MAVAIAAYVTCVGFLARVQRHVLLQVRAGAESLAANATRHRRKTAPRQ